MWTYKEFLYGGKFMIADMDSPTDFATLWNGFTSNKVRISVSASGLSSATGNVIVTKIMGYVLEPVARFGRGNLPTKGGRLLAFRRGNGGRNCYA